MLDDITDFDDDDLTQDIANVFNRVTEASEIRHGYYNALMDYFYDIQESGVLSHHNCTFDRYEPCITDKDRDKIISLIPVV